VPRRRTRPDLADSGELLVGARRQRIETGDPALHERQRVIVDREPAQRQVPATADGPAHAAMVAEHQRTAGGTGRRVCARPVRPPSSRRLLGGGHLPCLAQCARHACARVANGDVWGLDISAVLRAKRRELNRRTEEQGMSNVQVGLRRHKYLKIWVLRRSSLDILRSLFDILRFKRPIVRRRQRRRACPAQGRTTLGWTTRL